VLIVGVVAGLVGAGLVVAAPPPPSTAGPRRLPGWALYDRFCLACHGAAGDGRGPATPWLWPRPRDFTGGDFKWRRTDVGSAPAADDVAAAIRHGVAGTSMHGFAATLDDGQVAALVDVVLAFGPRRAAAPIARLRCGAPDAARGRELWQSMGCASCHGGGAGDGPAAAALVDAQGRPAAPYDLTRLPLRRPHAPGDERAAIVDSIAFGLAGTAMPGYRSAASAADVCAVADHVDAIRFRGAAARRPGPLAEAAIQLDRETPVRAGTWTGHGDAAEARLFGDPILPQGPPPPSLAPAQASLDARQCARCHAKQVREWTGSLHAEAASPGLLGQMVHIGAGGMAADDVESCLRCHAPLAEQSPVLGPAHRSDGRDTYDANPAYSPELRHQGVTCAACHVRGWVRHGPAEPSESLLRLPGYPRQELALHERADLCLPCHQLPARTAVAGRPLLDTYREWLEGPYMRRGVQCQHCHMPNREHTFRGVHDPDVFRQGIAVTATATRARGAVQVQARIANVGAGHMLPTTPTPAAWLTIELVDAAGTAIRGARSERRIGRHIAYQGGRWRELEDSRIPPGEHLVLRGAWQRGRVADARGVRVTVRVHPDDYYERFYQAKLRKKQDPEARRLYQQALARAIDARYVAYDRTFAITAPPARTR
jgi:hypothetical protein